MLTFAEDVALLVLDDETGALHSISPMILNQVLAGAVLMDLAYRHKLEVDEEQVRVADSAPTGDPILDPYLAEIAAGETAMTARGWIEVLSARGSEILEAALDALVAKNILKVVDTKILWVFETRRYPAIDSKEEREVKMRILDAVLSDETPDPRDVGLICLVDAGGIFNTILSERELSYSRARIAEIAKLDLIGQALARAVTQLRTDIAIATATTP